MKNTSKKRNTGVQLIKKSNDLIEARYRFDVWETRIFLYLLSNIRKEDSEFHTYRLWYKEMKKVFGVSSNRAYHLMREAAKSLMGKTFKVGYEDQGTKREVYYHIIRKVDVLKEGEEERASENQEYIDVTIEQEMMPFLLQLQRNFTAYDLRNVARLGSNPVRLYELLKQYESIGRRTIEIANLKRMLEIENEYPNFGQLNQSLIQPAIREINANTDLNVYKIDQIKTGRKVDSLCFYFRSKSEDDIKRLRGHADKSPKEMASGGDLEADRVGEESNQPIQQPSPLAFEEEYFDKLNEWWGIQREEFAKKMAGKTEQDIKSAILFTKSRIKMSKADNPAGVFLDALQKGHKTAEQQKIERKAEREQAEREKKAALQPIVMAYEQISEAYAKAINDGIRAITQETPDVTVSVIESIKDTYKALGDVIMQRYTIEDFRQNPMLRTMVKTEIMKRYPERFAAVSDRYITELKSVKAQIIAVAPDFVFG